MLFTKVFKVLSLLVVFGLIFSASKLWAEGSDEGDLEMPDIKPCQT